MYLWGLQPAVLDLVESYLGVPAVYRCVTFRRDIPNGQQCGTRFWHRDGEDYRVIKLIVYLNDVTLAGGPFEYIPRSESPSYRQFKGIHGGIRNSHMEAVVNRGQWRPCLGKKGTVVICDTASVFHHGAIPMAERNALIYTYFSRKAKDPLLGMSKSISTAHLAALRHSLSRRQYACLWENCYA